MNYYKIISDGTFVGIATQQDLLRFQLKHRILLYCDINEAQYIRCEGELYHDNWLVPINNTEVAYKDADIISISEDEYNILLDAVNNDKEIELPTEDYIESPEVVEPEEPTDITVEYVRSAKIAEMSRICHKTIEQGFDVHLSDGIEYHFSLTTQDQLNLITLSTMIAGGETEIPYHADGELCKFYSVEDATNIIATADAYKVYQVSYFNALKNYIQALNTIEELNAITYGMEIPDGYRTDVLKALQKKSN